MRIGILLGMLCIAFEVAAQEFARFEAAVDCIKRFEGLHSAQHHPYVGYGHRLLPGEQFPVPMAEREADSLLRCDLRRRCAIFRCFGRDSLLLGVLAYNVGEARLLGGKNRPRSQLIRKLEAGDRNIYDEYISFCRYKGKILPSLQRRRKTEYQLLFEK